MKKTLLIAALAFSIIGCGDKKNQDENGENKELSGTITVDGSSTVYPVTEAVAEEFRNTQPRVNVTIGVSGTGGGFQKFGRGEINIANASRSIKAEEKAVATENNVDLVELKVASDGIAVVKNPENDWLESITPEELKMIWEPAAQENIKRWNQIRPEWPNEEIRLYGPGVASGTFDYFTEAIVGKSGSSRGDYTASEDDNVLVQGIAGDKYALGFFGLAYYEENKDKLELVGITSGEETILPTAETVSDGTYPLARPLYIYVNSTSLENPEVVEFVRFYLNEVDELANDVGYISLPQEEYEAQIEKFNSFIDANTTGETAAE